MTDFVVDALAVCRLSRLVREDHIFDRPRGWLLVHERCRRWFPQFIKCPWCVSMWMALGVALCRVVAPRWWNPMARALAASYVASQAAVHTEPKD